MDLWVAWDPPITKSPRIQRLVSDVMLEKIVPPVTPDGPAAAILAIEVSEIGDLLYADRYGSLSVTLLPRG